MTVTFLITIKIKILKLQHLQYFPLAVEEKFVWVFFVYVASSCNIFLCEKTSVQSTETVFDSLEASPKITTCRPQPHHAYEKCNENQNPRC